MPSQNSTRIAVIGNSHAACLHSAWKEIGGSYPDVTLTFFCARSAAAADVVRKGLTLVPRQKNVQSMFSITSDGKTEIDLAEYDEILIFGLGARPTYLSQTETVSQAAAQAALNDVVESKPYFKLVRLISECFGKPIHVGHVPLICGKFDAGADQSLDHYHSGIIDINKKKLNDYGVRMWPQPDKTIVNGSNTEQSFSRGSERLVDGHANAGKPHPSGDRVHMNKEFGTLWLQGFLAGRRQVETGA